MSSWLFSMIICGFPAFPIRDPRVLRTAGRPKGGEKAG